MRALLAANPAGWTCPVVHAECVLLSETIEYKGTATEVVVVQTENGPALANVEHELYDRTVLCIEVDALALVFQDALAFTHTALGAENETDRSGDVPLLKAGQDVKGYRPHIDRWKAEGLIS